MDPAVASMYSAVVAAAAALFGVIITSTTSRKSVAGYGMLARGGRTPRVAQA